jgi:hypothetical protein
MEGRERSRRTLRALEDSIFKDYIQGKSPEQLDPLLFFGLGLGLNVKGELLPALAVLHLKWNPPKNHKIERLLSGLGFILLEKIRNRFNIRYLPQL